MLCAKIKIKLRLAALAFGLPIITGTVRASDQLAVLHFQVIFHVFLFHRCFNSWIAITSVEIQVEILGSSRLALRGLFDYLSRYAVECCLCHKRDARNAII